jgi:peptide chain release factor 1
LEYSTLIARLKTASESFENLEVQLADPDIANDPKKIRIHSKRKVKIGAFGD